MNNSDRSFVIASISEAGFVGIEVGHNQLDSFFDQIHRAYHPSGLAQELSRMIDKAPQYPMIGGFAHRIYYGHSLSSIKDVYERFGWEGFFPWMQHLGADVCSPDGLPVPFALELKNLLHLNAHEAVKTLCMNTTDIIALSFGISAATFIPEPSIKLSVAGAKLLSGIAHSDPTLIITATMGLVVGVGAILEKWSNVGTIKLSMEDFKGGPEKRNDVIVLEAGTDKCTEIIDLSWKG